jgi:signal recognition particle GTPase
MRTRSEVFVEAIVLSMTPEEPKVPNGSRRARIAEGSGRPFSEVSPVS